MHYTIQHLGELCVRCVQNAQYIHDLYIFTYTLIPDINHKIQQVTILGKQIVCIIHVLQSNRINFNLPLLLLIHIAMEYDKTSNKKSVSSCQTDKSCMLATLLTGLLQSKQQNIGIYKSK